MIVVTGRFLFAETETFISWNVLCIFMGRFCGDGWVLLWKYAVRGYSITVVIDQV